MKKYHIVCLALLGLVLLDASGDAFRLQGWQIAHHMMEGIQIIGWVALWALFKFNPVYIVMYILGRFVGFDITFNLIAGLDWWYVGESSLYGQFLTWFAESVQQPLGMIISMPKLIALVWWIAWFWTRRTFRELKP